MGRTGDSAFCFWQWRSMGRIILDQWMYDPGFPKLTILNYPSLVGCLQISYAVLPWPVDHVVWIIREHAVLSLSLSTQEAEDGAELSRRSHTEKLGTLFLPFSWHVSFLVNIMFVTSPFAHKNNSRLVEKTEPFSHQDLVRQLVNSEGGSSCPAWLECRKLVYSTSLIR